MNILLIGNGFDLAHGLPTRYTDFLKFVRMIKDVDAESKNGNLEKGSQEIEELLSLITDNFWLEYFLECPVYRKENWIDFESEIGRIIRSIDSDMEGEDFDGQIRELTNEYLSSRYLHNGMKKNGFGEWPGICKITYRELRDALLKDLSRLIRSLEIYLYSFVEKIPCNGILPDIQDVCFDKVLSFNYTDTIGQFWLGSMYERGKGVPKSDSEAAVWYQKAANAGNADAQRRLGKIYERRGEYGKAEEWYRKAKGNFH